MDQKTVIRAGYGIFFIPNWIFFNLNPSNDAINTGLDSVGRNRQWRHHPQQHAYGNQLRVHSGRSFGNAELPDQRALRSQVVNTPWQEAMFRPLMPAETPLGSLHHI